MAPEQPESLLERLKRREPRAQSELYRRYSSRLLLFFRMRIRGEDCYHDLTQEVFFSFFAALEKEKISGDEWIGPFIFGIAKRVVFNFFYKKKKNEALQRLSEENSELTCDFREEERLENEGMERLVQEAIETLPEVDRVILREFYLQGRDISEVSGLVGKTRHYVSVRKERALKKIKSEIMKLSDIYKTMRR